MQLSSLIAALVSIAAVFSYANHRFLRLPTAVGLMLIALVFSLALSGLGMLGLGGVADRAQETLSAVDFDQTLLHGMLSFLLFAGALHVDLNDLARQARVVASLATVSVLLSTAAVGGLAWWLLAALGLEIPLLHCLLFGALISPTDPIAVLGILKSAGAPKSLEIKIVGESLFNDGIGVVVFMVLADLAYGGHDASAGGVALLFLQEAVGGVVYGLVIGLVAYRMIKSVSNYQVEILLTLALVMGGYALAGALHVSGPIAVVVAGLLIGNHGRRFAMSDTTREHLDSFWELADEILNAVLFVLIGLEVLVLDFSPRYLLAGAALIPVVLAARLVSVAAPIGLLRFTRRFTPGVVRILTWGGLRGGISIALALSLPAGPERDTIVAITYVIVVFSVVVQGLTIGKVVRVVTGKREG